MGKLEEKERGRPEKKRPAGPIVGFPSFRGARPAPAKANDRTGGVKSAGESPGVARQYS